MGSIAIVRVGGYFTALGFVVHEGSEYEMMTAKAVDSLMGYVSTQVHASGTPQPCRGMAAGDSRDHAEPENARPQHRPAVPGVGRQHPLYGL